MFMMGLVTNLLNPEIPVLYLSLMRQFIDPAHGSVLNQSLTFGAMQLVISVAVTASTVFTAGSIARFLAQRPVRIAAQRWMMGTVLTALALRVATEARRWLPGGEPWRGRCITLRPGNGNSRSSAIAVIERSAPDSRFAAIAVIRHRAPTGSLTR